MDNINSFLRCINHPHKACVLFTTDPKFCTPLLCDICIVNKHIKKSHLINIDDVLNYK